MCLLLSLSPCSTLVAPLLWTSPQYFLWVPPRSLHACHPANHRKGYHWLLLATWLFCHSPTCTWVIYLQITISTSDLESSLTPWLLQALRGRTTKVRSKSITIRMLSQIQSSALLTHMENKPLIFISGLSFLVSVLRTLGKKYFLMKNDNIDG